MIVRIIIAMIVGFISGLLIGLDYQSKKDLDDMMVSFAETEHLRSENNYLRVKLGILEKEETAGENKPE